MPVACISVAPTWRLSLQMGMGWRAISLLEVYAISVASLTDRDEAGIIASLNVKRSPEKLGNIIGDLLNPIA